MMENNREFEQNTPEEQLFYRYFRGAEATEEGEWLAPTEIMETIRQSSSIPLSVKRVNAFGRILRKLEIPARHMRNGTFYHVIKMDGTV